MKIFSSLLFFLFSLFTILVIFFITTSPTSVDAVGWNHKKIPYQKFDKTALEEAKFQRKPILLLIHKTWCATCKQLRTLVEKSAEFEVLSEYFVMAEAEDDEEPTDPKYAPDGSYAPRILFLDGNTGEPYPIQNPAPTDPSALHYYASVPAMLRGMMMALQLAHGGGNQNAVVDLDDLETTMMVKQIKG